MDFQSKGKRRQVPKSLVLALLLCSGEPSQASQSSSLSQTDNQQKLFELMHEGSTRALIQERPSGPLEDDEFLQIGSSVDQTQSSEIDSSADQQEGQKTDAQSASEEQAYQQQKEQHRNEVAAYKQWFKYSPFYLRRHPEARQAGDIQDIQQLSQQRSANGDELAGVENVFEKNFSQFNKILSHSDASQQLAQVQNAIQVDQSQQSQEQQQLKHRKSQIQRIKKQIQKQKSKQSLGQVNRKHKLQRRNGKSAVVQKHAAPPMHQGKKNPIGSGSRSQQGHAKKHPQRVYHSVQPKLSSSFDHLDTTQQNDDTLFQSRQEQRSDEQRLTIVPATMRSFNSVPMEKNEMTNDYSKEAEVAKPNRRMMDKIAQLESQVLAMGHRIQQLEIEKKEDEGQLQLLQTKVRHFEEEEETGVMGKQSHAGSSILIHDGNDQESRDLMNLQLDQENVILDTISSLKDSIASLFTSTKKTVQGQDSKQGANSTVAKRETSLDRLNRVIKETDEKAEKKAKEDHERLTSRRPPSASLDQVKDAVNVQLASNNEMNLLSELQQFSSMISNLSAASNSSLSHNSTQPEATSVQHEKKKSWAEIKAEAKAELAAKKKLEAATHQHVGTNQKNATRPADAMNVQASESGAAEEEFEEQIEDDISLIGLDQQHFVPIRYMRNGNRMLYRMPQRRDRDDESETGEPQPSHEQGKMPRNVGMLKADSGPKRGFDQPVAVWGNPETYNIKNQPLNYNEAPDDEEEDQPVRNKKKHQKHKNDDEAEELEDEIKNSVRMKQRLRREKEMNKIKHKLENQEDRAEFEKAVREHRKMRKKAKKAKKDKKKKEKRKFRDNKDKVSTEDVADKDEENKKQEHDEDDTKHEETDKKKDDEIDTDRVSPSSMDKLRKMHDKIKKSQPGADDYKPEPIVKSASKPASDLDGPETEKKSFEEPLIPKATKKANSDEDDVRRAKEIIEQNKKQDQSVDSEIIDQAIKPFTKISDNENLKDHIKKAVEESVKKEVGDTIAKQSAACPLNSAGSPMTKEEKKKDDKNKKIQNEIAKEVRENGLDKKAIREVEARERQEKLHKVKRKLEKEIDKHAEAEKRAQEIASKLKDHHSVISKALQDTKRYREENKESGCGKGSSRDEYDSQDEHEEQETPEEEHHGHVRHHKAKRGHRHGDSPFADERISKKRFWRDHNDDDNPTYPELSRPPRRGNADIDQTENSDMPNLSRKEAEDFDRLVVEAKKEKEEKLKKEKEEKEKKEKEAKEKKDGKKEEKKDAKKSFSQMRRKKHHHRQNRHHPQMPFYNQGYVQLSSEMSENKNTTTLAAANSTLKSKLNVTSNQSGSSPKTVNISKPTLVAKNQTQQAVLKTSNTTGVIDLVQKNHTQNATTFTQINTNSTKHVHVNKNSSHLKAKKFNSTKKHTSAPIQEIEDDAEMETGEDIVESTEEQEKDFKEAELKEKAALETEEDMDLASHTANSLREQQEKWTTAEEIAEQQKLKEELEKEQKQQEELKKKEEMDKLELKKEKEREAQEEQIIKQKQIQAQQTMKAKLVELEKKEKETKDRLNKEMEQIKADTSKNQTEIEKAVTQQAKKIEEEDKKIQDQIQLQEKLTEQEEREVEKQIEREQQKEIEQEKKLMQLEKQEVNQNY